MEREEYIKEILNNDSELLSRIGKDHIFAISENIKQLRDLIKNFIIISSAIIGFIIPVFEGTELIKNRIFLTGGLAELLVVVLYGFFYLVHILQTENKGLTNSYREYIALLEIPREARNKFIFENTQGNHEFYLKKIEEMSEKIKNKNKTKTSEKPDYAMDIIYVAFFMGLLLIVLSMTNIIL